MIDRRRRMVLPTRAVRRRGRREEASCPPFEVANKSLWHSKFGDARALLKATASLQTQLRYKLVIQQMRLPRLRKRRRLRFERVCHLIGGLARVEQLSQPRCSRITIYQD